MRNAATAVVLVPNEITASMIAAGTSVPVVDSARGEIAWVAGAHANGATNVNCDGSLWTAIAAPGNIRPGTDTTKWRRTGPSNRMAPFDDQLNTKSKALGSLTYVLKPGFFTGMALYGLSGETLTVTLYDAPGGSIVETVTAELWDQPLGLYEYLFTPLRALTKWQRQDLPFFPDAQLHITVTAPPDREVTLGHIVVGHWQTLLGSGEVGGIEYGATAEIKTYSHMKTNDDGTVTIVPRHTATNHSFSVVIEAEQANAAHALLSQIASKPVAFIASGLGRYDYLNTFGIVSATVSPASWRTANLSLKVQGYV